MTVEAVHILCKQKDRKTKEPLGLTEVEGKINIYWTCCWRFTWKQAETLIGAMVFLHENKKATSFIGGKVLAVYPAEPDQIAPTKAGKPRESKDRVAIEFEKLPAGEGQRWQGYKGDGNGSFTIVNLED